MRKIVGKERDVTAIVTDSNSGITQEEARELGVFVLPMPFMIEDVIYYEGKDLTQETFYKRMEAGERISTSQPTPEEVTRLWEEVLKEHEQLVYIPMSSGLSGSCQTAQLLAGDYESRDIAPLMTRMFTFMRDFEGDVPGAAPKDCGNYLDMNLPMTKLLADKYLKEVLEGISEERLIYPAD